MNINNTHLPEESEVRYATRVCVQSFAHLKNNLSWDNHACEPVRSYSEAKVWLESRYPSKDLSDYLSYSQDKSMHAGDTVKLCFEIGQYFKTNNGDLEFMPEESRTFDCTHKFIATEQKG